MYGTLNGSIGNYKHVCYSSVICKSFSVMCVHREVRVDEVRSECRQKGQGDLCLQCHHHCKRNKRVPGVQQDQLSCSASLGTGLDSSVRDLEGNTFSRGSRGLNRSKTTA